METRAGIKLTKKQEQNVKDLNLLLKRWDKKLSLNAMAGTLYVMLLGDTKQNPTPEMSDTGGYNTDNIVDDLNSQGVSADGGDW